MKFRIRSKVVTALAVPLLALVAFSGFEAVQARAEADRVDSARELVRVALGSGRVTAALQDERSVVVADVIGRPDAAPEVGSFDGARDAVDATVRTLEAQLRGAGADVSGVFAPALDALDGLDEVRDRYENARGPTGPEQAAVADDLFRGYQGVIDAFSSATTAVAGDLDEATLRDGVDLVDTLHRRDEALAATTHHLTMDLLGGVPSSRARAAVSASAARARLLQDRVDQLAVGPDAAVPAPDTSRADVEQVLTVVDAHLAGEQVDLGEVLGAGRTGPTNADELATDAVLDEAAALASAARDEVRLFVLIAAAVVASAVLVTVLATASISRPLRALRREADELAHARLPRTVRDVLDPPPGAEVTVPELDPIEIRTRDEVGDVVAALNEVQATTTALAADQALLRRNFSDSFVNLGRRNQVLVDRQLDLITQLEQNETDPEQLAALFRLDHLATRMRRNAESLLVLAGVETPRQWGAPVRVTDVVRAGLGEVEEYQRVQIRHLDDAAVTGGAVAGLAHVVAELVENALAFSPPQDVVEVKGRWSGRGDYVLAIADTGIGMSEEDLDRANRRLSGQEPHTAATSRYLGHQVAGTIAAQLGVAVRLQDDPAGGLVATITLPAALVSAGETAESGEVPAGTSGAPHESPAPAPAAVDPGSPEAWDALLEPIPLPGRPGAHGHRAPSSRPPCPERSDPDAAHAPASVDASDLDAFGLDTSDADGPVLDGPEPDGPVLDGSVLDGSELDGPELDGAELDGSELDRVLHGRHEPAAGDPTAGDPADEVGVPDDPDGLPRRVPGAQRPDRAGAVDRLADRPTARPTDGPPDGPTGRRTATAGTETDDRVTVPADPRSGPEPSPDGAGALGFLHAFRSGDPTGETTEEDR